MPELTTAHILVAGVYLLAVGGVGAAAVLTGRRWLWWTLGALTLPLAGVVWLATLPGRRGAPRLQEPEPEPKTPDPPTELEHVADAIPDDHPDVTDARRERAERRARRALEYDDASRSHAEQLERELDGLLED